MHLQVAIAHMGPAQHDAVERERGGAQELVEQHQRASRRLQLETRERQRGVAALAAQLLLAQGIHSQPRGHVALAELCRQRCRKTAQPRVIAALPDPAILVSRGFAHAGKRRRRIDVDLEGERLPRRDDRHHGVARAAAEQHQLARHHGRLDRGRIDGESRDRARHIERDRLARGQAHHVRACRRGHGQPCRQKQRDDDGLVLHGTASDELSVSGRPAMSNVATAR